MNYDLSNHDRFFLNQLIPMWHAGKLVDINNDLKYVFHREKGTNYNPAQFEYTLKTLSEFIVDHGFARDAGKTYTYELQPKANMLLQKGSIEQFENYQNLQMGTGFATITRQNAPTPPEESIQQDVHAALVEKPGKFAVPNNFDILQESSTEPAPPPPPYVPPSQRVQQEPSFATPADHKGNGAATTFFSLLRIVIAVGLLFLLWYYLHGD